MVAESKTESKLENDASKSDGSTDGLPRRRSRRRKTSHLKKVPDNKVLREAMRTRCREVSATLDRSVPHTKDELEALARGLLTEMDLEEAYLGWVMVVLSLSLIHI